MKVEIFTPVSYYGPVEGAYVADTTARIRPDPRHALDGARLRAVRSRVQGRLRLAELRRAPLLDQPAESEPDLLRGLARAAAPGGAHRRARLRSPAAQPRAARGGVLDARQPPQRSPHHWPAPGHPERVPHVWHEPLGVEGGVQGGRARLHPRAHRARAVRLGGALLPLSQRLDLAAAGAAAPPADPALGQQPGLRTLCGRDAMRPRLQLPGPRGSGREPRALQGCGARGRVGADSRQHPLSAVLLRGGRRRRGARR